MNLTQGEDETICLDSWKEFCSTNTGYLLRKFMIKLQAEMAEPESVIDGKKPVLILNTRKGYWIYKVFEKNEGLYCTEGVEVFSDRYLKKITDFQQLQNRYIYLVDDTLSHGINLLESYIILSDMLDENMIIPVVFALSREVDQDEKCALSIERKQEYSFWKKLQCYIRMYEEELGEFCVQEMLLLHKQRVPFVIDLPFLKDSAFQNEKMNFEIKMSEEQFLLLQKKNKYWKFQFNHMDIYEKRILNGFFIEYQNNEFLNKLDHYVLNLVVEGTYEKKANGEISLVFIPFAIMKSVSIDFLKDLRKTLYKGFELAEHIREEQQMNTVIAKGHYVAMYRECVYLLSLFIAQEFRQYISDLLKINLTFDFDIMQEHFTKEYMDLIKKMDQESLKNPKVLYDNIINTSFLTNDYPYFFSKKNMKSIFHWEKDDIYKKVSGGIIESRMQCLEAWENGKLEVARELEILPIEECGALLENMDTGQVVSSQKRNVLTGIILLMLNTSQCSNMLQFSANNQYFIRGFRYGENSDLLLPFINIYFYWAIYLFVQEKKTDYGRFINQLKCFFEKNRLFDEEHDEHEFELNRIYYEKVLENKLPLKNKFFYIKPYIEGKEERNKTIILDKIERFVARYQ